jgi:hypothetical protein
LSGGAGAGQELCQTRSYFLEKSRDGHDTAAKNINLDFRGLLKMFLYYALRDATFSPDPCTVVDFLSPDRRSTPAGSSSIKKEKRKKKQLWQSMALLLGSRCDSVAVADSAMGPPPFPFVFLSTFSRQEARSDCPLDPSLPDRVIHRGLTA